MNIINEKGNLKIKLIIGLVFVLLICCIISIVVLKNKNLMKDNKNIANANYEYFTLYSIDGKVGVVDKTGNVLIEPQYNQIYIPNQLEDVFICFDENTYKILDNKNHEIFQKFDDVSAIIISENTLETEKYVLVYKENGLYGLVDLSEKKLTEPIYENISSLKNKPGNILVKKDGLYGVLDSNGKEIIQEKYNSIKSDEFCSETDGYAKTGYIISKKEENGIIYGYADSNGKILIQPKYESITRCLEYEDSDVYLIVMENGKKGVIKNKKQIIKNKYQSINYSNISNIFTVDKNGKYGFYSNTGSEILKPEYTDYSIAGNYIFVEKDGETKLYDVHGNLINTNKYKNIIETENPQYFIAQNDEGYYSIISKDVQIEEKYTNITYAFDNFFIFTNEDSKSGVLNIYTGIEIEPEYDLILLTGTVNALEARKGNAVDIYSRKIEKVLTMSEGIVENIEEDYLIVYSKSEMQYLNKSGEIIKNTDVYPNLKMYSIEKDGKWGFADSTGKIIVDCKYDMLTELNEYGYAGILQDEKWGVVDENGKVIVVPSYEIETYYSPKFIGKYQLEELDNIHCLEIEK